VCAWSIRESGELTRDPPSAFDLQAHQPLEVRTLSQEQKAIAAHMAAVGVLAPGTDEDRMLLFPTFMAAMLCGGRSATPGASIAGFIVVETSFRVYAYTTSPVQVCIRSMHQSAVQVPVLLHTEQPACFVFCTALLPHVTVL
jgi:Transcription factor Tfb2